VKGKTSPAAAATDHKAARNLYRSAILARFVQGVVGRGLHSSTFQLNLSALYWIGGTRRGCVACVKGVLGVVYGV